MGRSSPHWAPDRMVMAQQMPEGLRTGRAQQKPRAVPLPIVPPSTHGQDHEPIADLKVECPSEKRQNHELTEAQIQNSREMTTLSVIRQNGA